MFTEYSPKRFDLEHADMAPFPCNRGPLPTETKRQIYQEHCRGDSAAALAQRFCRTRTSIYGVIKEIRAARIMELPLDCMGSETLRQVGAAVGVTKERVRQIQCRAMSKLRMAADEDHIESVF